MAAKYARAWARAGRTFREKYRESKLEEEAQRQGFVLTQLSSGSYALIDMGPSLGLRSDRIAPDAAHLFVGAELGEIEDYLKGRGKWRGRETR